MASRLHFGLEVTAKVIPSTYFYFCTKSTAVRLFYVLCPTQTSLAVLFIKLVTYKVIQKKNSTYGLHLQLRYFKCKVGKRPMGLVTKLYN